MASINFIVKIVSYATNVFLKKCIADFALVKKLLKIWLLVFLSVILYSQAVSADSVQYFYDPAGRLSVTIDPVNGSALYSYDPVGNIVSVVRRPITAIMVAQPSLVSGSVGTVVSISGAGFGTTSNTSVRFNGVAAVPSSVTATSLVVAVPAGATSGVISITSPAGTASSSSRFTVVSAIAPTISGFTPSQVDQGGIITITGSGFDSVLERNKVLINDRYAYVTAATATSLTVVVPVVSSGRVTIQTPSGSASSGTSLGVPPAPYLASAIGSIVQATLGTPATLSIGAAGKVGIVLFDGVGGQRVATQMNSSAFGGANVRLYGPDGFPVGASSPLDTGGIFDTQTLPLSGTYSLVFDIGNSTGSASVTVLNVPPDVTAPFAANGTPVTLTTTVPGQNMVLTFDGSAGQWVNLRQSLSGANIGSSTQVTIVQPDGLTQVFNGYGFGNGSTDVLVLPVAGTYTIRVNPPGKAVGSATLTLYNVPPDASAAILANGAPVTLTTTVPGQNMAATFAGTAGQRINVQQSLSGPNMSSNTQLSIVQPDGTTQLFNGYSFGNGSTDVLVLPIAGNYTIRVNPAYEAVGSATLTLYNVPSDVTATISANSTPVTLTNTVPGQNMVATFAGTAGQRVNLQQTLSGSNIGLSTRTTIFQPDGTTQLFNAYVFGNDSTDVLVLPVSGTYTIKVDPQGLQGLAVGSATLTLYNVPPDVSATILANGTPVTITNTVPGQNMVATFAGTAGQRVNLRYSLSGSNIGIYTYGKIFQPDGTTKLFDGYFTNGSTDVLVLPVSGTYTIKVDPLGSAVGSVTLTLYNLSPDASGTITAGGGSVGLTITQPGQNGSLTFTGTAGTRVSLLSQFDSNLATVCNTVRILKPDGLTDLYNNFTCNSSVFSDAIPAADTVSSVVPTLPVTGTYTLKLDPRDLGTGTGTFTLYSLPPDVSGAVTMGQAPVNFTLTAPGQAIRASFTGQANQSVSLNVATVSVTPTNCFRITALNPDGKTILFGELSCNAAYTKSSLVLPQAGVYTVVIDPNGTTTGTYSFGVSTP